MRKARFTHINNEFLCENCSTLIPPLARGCRNHCPKCLTCKHVDFFPGDRANPCQGLMDAVSYHLTSKKGIVLTFKCRTCTQETRNKAACDDINSPDSYEEILKLGNLQRP